MNASCSPNETCVSQLSEPSESLAVRAARLAKAWSFIGSLNCLFY